MSPNSAHSSVGWAWPGSRCPKRWPHVPNPISTSPSRLYVPPKRENVSRQFINEYRAELDRLRSVSGRRREGVLSETFGYCEAKDADDVIDNCFSVNEDQGPRRYYLSSLSTLPWAELGEENPTKNSGKPKSITSDDLHIWSLWLALATVDFAAALNQAVAKGVFEIARLKAAEQSPTQPRSGQ